MPDKLSSLLKEYFEPDQTRRVGLQAPEPPIKPSPCNWEVFESPERFSKTFKASSRARLIDFVNEVLAFEDEVNHHGEIVIKYDEVSISVYTHTVNRITEIDQEYIRTVDNIYRDVLDFEYT